MKRIFLLALVFARMNAADTMSLTLHDAVELALKQNRALKIARLKVEENEQKKAGAHASYFPKIETQSTFLHTTSVQNIRIPAGALGVYPATGAIPGRELILDQGNQTFETIGTTAAQPLTPLIRIRQANRIAASEVAATRDELKKAENEVAVKVHEVYYGILIAQLQRKAAEQQQVFVQARLRESQEDVRNGNALKVTTLEGETSVLESRQALLTLDLQLADLNTELNDLLGTSLDAKLVLSPADPVAFEVTSREAALKMALSMSPEISAANELIEQAKAGVKAAKSEYIPDISVFARQSYQNGVPFLVHNFGTFGVLLNYDVFDFGKRRATVREREAKLAQAEENLERLKEAVSVRIERGLNKVERTRQLLDVASQVVKLRTDSEHVAENQVTYGVIVASGARQASAATYKAQADLLQAQLSNLLAVAELQQTVGQTPGR